MSADECPEVDLCLDCSHVFRNVPLEISQQIFSYLDMSAIVMLSQVSVQIRSCIRNERTYNTIVDNFGLPRVFGMDPLRVLYNSYTIIRDKDSSKYEYLVDSAIVAQDHKWILSQGLNYATPDTTEAILEFLVKHDHIDDLEKLMTYLEQKNGEYPDIFDYFYRHGNVRAYKYMKRCGILEGLISISTIAFEAASYGHERFASYAVSKLGAKETRVLAGYLVGKHYELYTKYVLEYNVLPRFCDGDIDTAMVHSNLQIMEHVYEKYPNAFGIEVYHISDTLSYNANATEFVLSVMRDVRFNKNILRDIHSCMAHCVRHCNVQLVRECLALLSPYKVYGIDWLYMAAAPLVLRQHDYEMCVRTVVEHIPNSKRDYMAAAKSTGNVELVMILESL